MDVVRSHKHKKSEEKHKKSKKSDKKKKRKRSRSASSDSSDRNSSKHKKKKSKKSKKSKETSGSSKIRQEKDESDDDYGIPVELMNTKAKAPESKEEYDKRQSQIRRVYDEETGRHRLIKGDGEVIEEIVSKKAHDEINKIATQSDGSTFQKTLGLNKK